MLIVRQKDRKFMPIQVHVLLDSTVWVPDLRYSTHKRWCFQYAVGNSQNYMRRVLFSCNLTFKIVVRSQLVVASLDSKMERKWNDRDCFEQQIPVFCLRYTKSSMIIEHRHASGHVCIGKECKDTNCPFFDEKTPQYGWKLGRCSFS